jgi:hypothetical protein
MSKKRPAAPGFNASLLGFHRLAINALTSTSEPRFGEPGAQTTRTGRFVR